MRTEIRKMKASPTTDRLVPRPPPARDADGAHVRPVRSLAACATLFREGDVARHLYEIVSGTLRLTRVLETGKRQVVAFAHPGDVVGFPAGGLHHADCEALTDVTVIAHRRSALEDAGRDPALHRRLQTAALTEISRLQDHLLMLARKGATGKLAGFLSELADRQGAPEPRGIDVSLEMPRADVADYLCLSPETVSRTLTRMSDEGLILRDGATRLIVTDRAGLRAMACAD
jgi:CRP/FNR family transcriptional regulator/CRP/FNR family nitrogen fixation transcriptional regulator